MKKPKLTPWLPAHVKPVHVGWYERRWPKYFTANDYWDGVNWNYGSPDGTFIFDGPDSDLPWRGLANPPKETKQKGEK